MKKTLFIATLFLGNFMGFGQEQDSSFIFDEVSISVNRTFVSDANTTDQYGFGLGIYHTFRKEHKLNVRTGVEFNQTGQKKGLIYEGEYILFDGQHIYEKTFTNVNYRLNCLSVPLTARYNFGSKIKFFAEGGIYADLMFNARRDAYMFSAEWRDTAFVVKNEDVQESVNLVNTIGSTFSFGIRFPIKKYELIIRPEYKFAFRKVYDSNISITDMYNHYAKLTFGFKW
ncbi:MAG: outer membrane beta-barrel protein [Flavobacteriia bacterium]|nr:outer membrane beta-barrel protein [Flavobacteriia bacterium]